MGRKLTKRLHPDLEDIATAIAAVDEFAIDIECFAPNKPPRDRAHLDPRQTVIVGISLATDVDNAWYIPFGVDPETGTKYESLLHFANVFEPIFDDPDKVAVAWNAKFDDKVLGFNGIYINDTIADPMIASYLCDENFPHGLKDTSKRELGIPMRELPWGNPYSKEFIEYGTDDARRTIQLWQEVFKPRLAEEGMDKPFWSFMMPSVRIAGEMELNGILMDVDYLKGYVVKADARMLEIQNKLFDMAGAEFNLNSAQQIGQIMFGLHESCVEEEPEPPKPKVQTKKIGATGKRKFRKNQDEQKPKRKKKVKEPPPSFKCLNLPTKYTSLGKPIGSKQKQHWKTNESVLKKLALLKTPSAEFPRLILEYRKLTKRVSTYCHPFIDVHCATPDGRIHCDLNTIGTETGRWAARNPNTMNFPRADEDFSLRAAVIPAPGYKMLSADFDQIELRLMAEISQDPAFIQIFKRMGKCDCATWKQSYAKKPTEPRCRHVDPHLRMAEDAKVTRQDAKAVNFGAIYGMGWQTLVAQVFKFTGRVIGEGEARHMLKTFFKTYHGVKRYHNWVQNVAIQRGWIKTICGRKRRLFFVDTSDWRGTGEAFRELTNSSIQGSAADIMMLALRDIDRERRARAEEDPIWEECKFVSMIHDEVLMEVPEEIADEAKDMVIKRMENCITLRRVPVSASGDVGSSWGAAH